MIHGENLEKEEFLLLDSCGLREAGLQEMPHRYARHNWKPNSPFWQGRNGAQVRLPIAVVCGGEAYVTTRGPVAVGVAG